MATSGKNQTLMPVSSDSLFMGVKTRLQEAATKARAMNDTDLNMTQTEIDEADWASHSFRRGADKQATHFSAAVDGVQQPRACAVGAEGRPRSGRERVDGRGLLQANTQ